MVAVTEGQLAEQHARAAARTTKPFWRRQYVLVIGATILGAATGAVVPSWSVQLNLLAEIFISLVKMTIAPLIFLVIVGGITQVGDMKSIGRLGLKALIYFEIITTICMLLSFVVAHLAHPGNGVAQTTPEQAQLVAKYSSAQIETLDVYLKHMIPDNFIGAFTQSPMQVLIVAVLTGLGLVAMGEKGTPIRGAVEKMTQLAFSVVHLVVSLAPFGAFGAMAFTVGKFGVAMLLALGYFVLVTWALLALFAIVVLGLVLRLCGISLMDVVRLLRNELVLVFGTSSSEAAIPGMMEKLTQAGVGQASAGFVIPAGYSFNLDGVALTLPISALFIAQVYGVPLNLQQELSLFVVIMFTSKGAAGVTGGAFATLAATVVAGGLPVQGLALLLGVDRFMSLGRAIINTLGNAVAAIVVAKWDGNFDKEAWRERVAQESK